MQGLMWQVACGLGGMLCGRSAFCKVPLNNLVSTCVPGYPRRHVGSNPSCCRPW